MSQLLYDQTLNKEALSYEETFRLKEVLMQSLRNKVKDWFKCQMAVIALHSAVAVDFITEVPSKIRLQNAL